MANSHSKLDQALRDLIEAYMELEEDLDEKLGQDEESYDSAIIETLETSIETALEEQDTSTTYFATLLDALQSGLEQLDPSAFEGDDDDDDLDYDIEDVDYDIDDDDDDDIDLDEDEEDDD